MAEPAAEIPQRKRRERDRKLLSMLAMRQAVPPEEVTAAP